MLQVELSQAQEMMRVQQAFKSVAQGRDTVNFAEIHRAAMAEGDEREMDWFRNRTYQALAQAVVHRSVRRCAVDISAEALRSMQSDPRYRQQVLDNIERDFSASYDPRQINLFIHVGTDMSEYSTRTWSAEDNSEFNELSAGCFFRSEGPSTAGAEQTTVVPGAYRFFRPQTTPGTQTRPLQARSAAYRAAAYGIR